MEYDGADLPSSQAAGRQQLLEVREQAVREQAARLEVALGEVREFSRQRDQAEASLRRQIDALHLVLDSIADGVVIADETGTLRLLNRTAEEILGVGLIEVPVEQWAERYGCYLPDRVTPYPSDQLPLARALRGETVQEEEVFIRHANRPDGIWVSVNAAPLRDSEGRPHGGVAALRDVTARKQAEEILKRTAAELARSNEDLQQFAYVVSHDLREPLRMVSGFCRLLRDRYHGKLDRRADEFLDFAMDGAARMDKLITDLLAYARVGTRGKVFAPTDSSAVFEGAIANLGRVVEESGAEVTRGHLPTVLADESQLGQLAQNLLANALKFHGPRPPRVHVSAERVEGGWRFAVRDHGIGIAPADLGRIFGVFERLHPSAEYPGSGIGLAICKRIVERHGGRIWVESEPGRGSTFYFTLSDQPAVSNQQSAVSEEKAVAAFADR
ncbi:MAG: ATP-binding protein [Gemmataceae bacterium]|nr:ATP-binding protein [Gemmataceae bacterium]